MEIEENVREGMQFVEVSHVDEVLQAALLEPVEMKKPVVFRSREKTSHLGFHISSTSGDMSTQSDGPSAENNGSLL